MAELADGRVYKRKRIKDPTDENNYIDIPVLYQANFKTMQEQAQETTIYFNNSSTSSRSVHVQRVTNPDDGSYLDVERIDEWYSKTAAEQAQEQTNILRNTDPPPIQPNGTNNPSHESTHIVRYYKDNAAGSQKPWIDVELIDQLKIVDASSQYQEWFWYLKHPELDFVVDDASVPYVVTIGYCDPSLELATLESNFDPPYRTDPFQNIINCKWTSEEPPTGGGQWIFWIRNIEISNPEHDTRWRWRWLQMNPGDPAYVLNDAEEVDYGVIGTVPFSEFSVADGLDYVVYERYKEELYAAASDARLNQGGRWAIVEFIISDGTA